MSVDQILAYARATLEMLGLYNFLIAFVLVSVALATFRRLFGGD